jgi:hypothetical protein
MSNSESNTIVIVETANQEVDDVAKRASAAAVVAAPRKCRPFSLSIMVYSPESGYKFEIEIEKSCTATNDTVWKFVFMLYKKNQKNEFELLVSIKFTATTPEEAQGIAEITKTGLTEPQFDTVNNEIFPLTKILGNEGRNATPVENKKFNSAARKIVTTK